MHSSESLRNELYGDVDRLAAEHQNELVAMRHDIHAHPELSNREERTAGVVADHLHALKLDEIRTGIAGHGVVGVLRGGLPGDRVIALRADMDALPVKETSGVDFASTVVDDGYPGGPFPVAHACGHDCHTATIATTATVLSTLRARLPGTVLFVFQPAEEGPPVGETGGAQAMLDQGALADPEPTMVFGMHVAPFPKGFVGCRVGNQFAGSCLVRITIRGVQVHASMPWMGVDPMPVAAEIVSGAGQLCRQIPAADPITVTIGHIEDVGRFNIIPGQVVLSGTIRCSIDSDMVEIRRRLSRMAENTARAYGCTATVEYLQNVPPVHNTQAWMDAAMPTLERVVGKHSIVHTPPVLGYDDVSVFVNTFGGLYLNYGVQDVRMDPVTSVAPVEGGRGMAPNHNPAFYADDAALETSVRIHANVAIDHLSGALAI